MTLTRLKIGTQIWLVTFLAGAGIAILAALGGWQILALRHSIGEIHGHMDVQRTLAAWQGQTSTNAARTIAIIQSGDEGLAERLAPAMKQTTERISEMQQRIAAIPMSEAQKRLFSDVGQARKAYISSREDLLKLRREGHPAALDEFSGKFTPALREYEDAIQAFVADHARSLEDARGEADNVADRYLIALVVMAILFEIFAAVFAYLLARSITRPIAEAVRLANKVADGDLTGNIEVTTGDEVGLLLAALKRMNENLKKIVHEVRSGTDMISTASQEINSGNTDLSQRTEEQASSLEETAASIAEFAASVKENAENAKLANQLGANASTIAAKGGEVVNRVVDTMGSINDSSKKIVDIITVIDSLTFQTNILALNAAVEAARAGEQGRGFAVVAGEVRSLAQRSAAAAKKIKALIGDSVEKVANGSKLVDEAGKTMLEILTGIQQVTAIVGEISDASQQQRAGIEQVNQAMTQMDKVTQQNAALVEESAAAAESLQDQAGRLAETVRLFKLDDADEAAPSRSAWAEPPQPRRTRPARPLPSAKFALATPGSSGNDEWKEF